MEAETDLFTHNGLDYEFKVNDIVFNIVLKCLKKILYWKNFGQGIRNNHKMDVFIGSISFIKILKESAEVFMIEIFKEETFFCKILVIEEAFFGQRLFRVTVYYFKSVLSFWVAYYHSKNPLLPLELELPDLKSKLKITGFPSALSTGLSLE